MKSQLKRGRKREIWHPADYELADIVALQQLARGEATAEQQKRALDWIITNAAQTYDEPFDPASTWVSGFVLGRGNVGRQIVKLLKLKPELFRDTGPR